MKSAFRFQLTACLFVSMAVGCSSVRKIPSAMKSLVSHTPEAYDPLKVENGNVSNGYKQAKKDLVAAEETLLKFARWQEDMGDHEEAKQRYRDIIADNANCIEARLGIARIEFKTGRKLEAEEILQSAVRMHPQSTQAWNEMGRVYSEQEQWEKAVVSLQKAVDTAKSDDEKRIAHYQLGVALAKNEQLEEGRRHLALAGGESASLYNIGYILHEAGRDQEATTWFQRALESQPDEQTKRNSEQMLVSITKDLSTPLAQLRQKNSVNVALTSYQDYRETPGSPQLSPAGLPRTDSQQTPGRSSMQLPASTGTPVHRAALPTSGGGRSAWSATPNWNGPASQQSPAFPPVAESHERQAVEPAQWKSAR